MAFEDLLQSIVSDQADRDQLATFATKYPALKESMLRQEDYSRKMDAVKTDIEELGKWRDWKKTAWDEEGKGTKAELFAKQQALDLQRQLEEAKLTGGDVNFEEIMTELDKRAEPLVKAKVDAVLSERKVINEKQYLDDVNARLNGVANAFERTYVEANQAQMEHYKTFGEVLPLNDLLKFQAENKLASPREAYEKMYKTRLDELKTKADQEREAKIREDERTKVKTEIAQSAGGQGNMIDHSGPPAQMGPLQRRKMEAAKAAKPGEGSAAELGSGITASLAAEKYEKQKALEAAS